MKRQEVLDELTEYLDPFFAESAQWSQSRYRERLFDLCCRALQVDVSGDAVLVHLMEKTLLGGDLNERVKKVLEVSSAWKEWRYALHLFPARGVEQ